MWEYTDKVKEYFFNPKNAGELAEANGVGEVGSISCGDALKLMIKVDPATDVITDAAFLTFGCGSAIASSSALTELVKGKTTAQALALTNQDIAEFLGGLPPEKMHCSVMGAEALRAAVANYRGEALEEDDHEEGALVCKCFGIDAGVIERAVRSNKLKTLEEVTHFTKAGGSCKTCHERIEDVLIDTHKAMAAEGLISADEVFGAKKSTAPKPNSPFVQIGAITKKPAAAAAPAPAPAPAVAAAPAAGRMTTLQKIKLIEEAIESIRPTLKADGGDIELVDVDGDNVLVKLTGACSNCQLARVTVDSIQHRIIEALGRPVRVIPTSALS